MRLLGDWADGGGTMHRELADRIRHLVRTGAVSSGARLPSERSLSLALNVSRNTVAAAFDGLRGEGILSSRQGDGTYVSANRRHTMLDEDDRLSSFVPATATGCHPGIDLRSAALPGLPMTADQINLLDGARMRSLIASHGYLPAGLPELREAIAAYYDALGLPTEPANILVTSGAQQAMRLVASSFVYPGATVVVEEPCFRGMIQSLKALGARLVGVPSGPDGVDVDALSAAVRTEKPALVIVQSTVHNPTGSVMDAFRRSHVARISARYGVPVIDDATLADTIIDGERRPLPLALGSDTIVTIGSMSKSFWGGLRVGWARAHTDVVEQLVAVKGGEDLGTSVLAQLVASALLPQIDRARDERHTVLSEARQSVLSELAGALPDWAPQIPSGGASLWVRMPVARATAFAQRAARDGVRLLPGPTFSSSDGLDDHMRISYANPSAVTARGIALMAQTWQTFERN